MKVRPRKFPHPVLSPFSDDLPDCGFQATVLDIKPDGADYLISVCVKTSSARLEKLIREGRARYACHVECAATKFRTVKLSEKEEFAFTVPADSLEGKTELCFFVVAVKDIDNYNSPEFHPDYENLSFRIKRGDILAVDDAKTFIAEKEVDPLKKIPSIFTAALNTEEGARAVTLDITGHKVVIRLPKEDYRKYTALSLDPRLHPVLGAVLVVPALIHLLNEIKNGSCSDMDDHRWYRVLAKRLKKEGIDLDRPENWPEHLSPLELAQRLIGYPVSVALGALERMLAENS